MEITLIDLGIALACIASGLFVSLCFFFCLKISADINEEKNKS